MHLYMCKYCGTMVEKSTVPITSGCSVHGTHTWVRLCEKGSVQPGSDLHPYKCRYCGKMVYCHSAPGCAEGCPNNGIHGWNRLG